MPDYIGATPRNRMLGLLADALQGVQDYAQRPDPTMPGGKANAILGLLADMTPLQSLATTANRMSYGEPLTNYGKANVPMLKPETADTLLAVASALPAVSRGLLKGSDKAVQAITGNPRATATGVVDYARSMVPATPATVWHGSPHKFDKFDASKIGTGEGAQAYGHGLYLAESPEVARSYAPTAVEADVKANLDSMRQMLPSSQGVMRRNLEQAIAEIEGGYSGGQLYKVDLPDEAIAKMLDWDKPLSQQAPEVQSALQSMVGDVTSGGFDLSRAPRNLRMAFDSAPAQAAESVLASKYGAKKTAGGWVDNAGRPIPQDAVDKMLAKLGGRGYDNAGQLYSDLTHVVGSQADVSSVLRNNGIPGIRYLDGGSRAGGQGTSNFVVFPGNEGLLTILERNGQPIR